MYAKTRTALLLSLLVAPALASAAQQGNVTRRDATPQRNDTLRATHVLNRLTFGSRPGDLERVMSMGVDRWIELQLQPESIPDSAAQAAALPASNSTGVRFASTLPVIKIDTIRTMVKDTLRLVMVRKLAESRILFSRNMDPAAVGRVTQAEVSERQLLEVVNDFWLNHFSVFRGKVPSPQAIGQYASAIRPLALGKFRDLLGAVAHSPAMLFYLDNHLSVADSLLRPSAASVPPPPAQAGVVRRPAAGAATGLNENYARELLELHTLGVDGGYTQGDVINVARAFTGWTIGIPATNGTFTFDASKHDTATKTILGHVLRGGRGIEDGEEVLDILARHPSTAKFIARKLAVRLVSDDPSDALVARAASAFTKSDGDISEVVRAIVTSDEFFAPATFRAKVKSPSELILAMRRAISGKPDNSPASVTLMNELSQTPWGKETPDGWPETGSAWMTSGAMFNRVGIAMRVAAGDIPSMSLDSSAVWRELATATFDRQLDAVVKNIFGGTVSPETRSALQSVQASKDAGGASLGSKALLRELVAMAFSSPEFQRR